MTGPLAGIRIVDLSRILAGPFATQMLADLGAEVMKVEPLDGDPTRQWGPPFTGDGDSAYFRSANRGKSSRALDLRTATGRAEVFELIDRADVVVENFLPASARALALTPETLRVGRPRLIVASIRAFASDTAAADRAGYDFLMQAEAGWMQFTGEPDGRPLKVGAALVDVLAGLYCGNAIQAALLRRERDGRGAHVEIPLFEVALAATVNVGAAALLTGDRPRRFGNAHPSIVPYQSFACRDGEVAIAVGNDRQFAALAGALGFPIESEWRTNPGRVVHREAIVAAIEGVTGALPVADVVTRCRDAEVAAGPVRSVDEALREEGSLHRAIHRSNDPERGEIATLGTPILVDGERQASEIPPPPRPSGGSFEPAGPAE